MLGILAACLLGLAAPANAALVQLGISGAVDGTKQTIVCGPSSPMSCITDNKGSLRTDGYQNSFDFLINPIDLKQGANSFEFGGLRNGGVWTGTIFNDNGVLTGSNLLYRFETGNFPTQTIGAYSIRATATTFRVTAVPEPGTWALMLVGFLVVGSALRQQPRRASLPAAA
ncbi:hypothetical protein GCM10022211_10750 [Sphingomonas humi]|uniref:Ice-binding protein C-terminal domain-containing protein n=2 Tax=Sphingomonas humi TaxID=335630 RepID=A0ABP7RSV2_9SPHN